jgi:alkylation response protein AidB-like acyl-CoA dehydrogenase
MADYVLVDNEVERDLRLTVGALLADRCDNKAIAELYDGSRPAMIDVLWEALAYEMDLAGLLVPAERGGADGSAREAAVVMEELGRWVAPVPFLTSAVIATATLLNGDTALLIELVDNRRTACLAVSLATAPHGPLPTRVVADKHGRLSGTISSVAGAIDADLILVPAITDTRIDLYSVERTAIEVNPVVSLDMTRQLADVRVDHLPCERVTRDAEAAIRVGLETGAGLLASEQVGIAQWCLQTSIAYLKQRRQFGRVVGGFQALKHRIADLFVAVEQATAAARYAASALAAGDADAPVAVSTAKSFCSDVALRVAEESIQLHGGIGMTWEYPLHLYVKRAKSDQIALGTPADHRARLAHLVDLPAPSMSRCGRVDGLAGDGRSGMTGAIRRFKRIGGEHVRRKEADAYRAATHVATESRYRDLLPPAGDVLGSQPSRLVRRNITSPDGQGI